LQIILAKNMVAIPTMLCDMNNNTLIICCIR